MRRLLPALIASLCVAAVAIVAVWLAGTQHHQATHQAARRGVVTALPGSVNVVRYQKFGGAEKCQGDSCGVGVAARTRPFTLPLNSGGYHSILTVSFRYSAFGRNATFAVRPRLGAAHGVSLLPAVRPVLSTNGRFSTASFVVRPALLAGGLAYHLALDASITHRLAQAGISLTQVVYSLQAWTAA
jgi:hypothetical protein